MARYLHLSRKPPRASRTKICNFGKVRFLTCSRTRHHKIDRRNHWVSSLGKQNIHENCYRFGGLSAYKGMGQLSTQYAAYFSNTWKGSDYSQFDMTPKNQRIRAFNHHLVFHGQKQLPAQSPKRGLLLRSKHYGNTPSFGRGFHAISVHNFELKSWSLKRHFSASTTLPAVLETDQAFYREDDITPLGPHQDNNGEPNIRERLQLWDVKYRAELTSAFDFEKSPPITSLGKHDPTDLFDDKFNDYDLDDVLRHTYDRGDIVDLGNERPFLLRGDMVELRASNCFRVELAIFVRLIGSQYQYYTMSGKWINQKSRLGKYCVSHFVDAQEVDPLLEFLPSKAVPDALQDKLQSFEYALPRDVGSPLIKKMLDFWKSSDRVYREAALELDNAHRMVAHKHNIRRATLTELAHQLLPKRYLEDGIFPAPVLYALHRSLMLDGLGFRLQTSNGTFSDEFEISPACEIESITRVAVEIRRYHGYLAGFARGDQSIKHISILPFLKFIEKARHIIQKSRKTRLYTPHGMVGPAMLAGQDNVERKPSEVILNSKDYFDTKEQSYIRFIASWAALRTFQNNSYLHGAASAVLRATGMYDDTVLDQRVGWTFLQEVGAVAPWENRVHFNMRLPSTTSLVIPAKQLPKESMRLDTNVDLLHGLRKDWGDLPVYCIDSESASEIDDGISVELTDVSDEYWLHVHVADPASMIAPHSVIAQNAQSAMRTIYLPDRVIRMLPSHVVQNHLSLGPNRRCLTFSARVNLKGALLDTKITPGILRNVLYLTSATFQSAIGELPSTLDTVVEVGANEAPPTVRPSRRMLESHEVTELHQRNFKLLDKLGKAQQLVSSSKGRSLPEDTFLFVSVATDNASIERDTRSNYLGCSSDPYIQMKFTRPDAKQKTAPGNMVMNMMLLAGVAAARWCQERGVPVINRVSQPLPDDLDPREYFRRVIMPLVAQGEPQEEAQRFSEDNEHSDILPSGLPSQEAIIDCHLFADYRDLPLDIVLEYRRLLGSVVPSTTPGVHLHLGLDMFARVTSPLRRYSDMLVHWQIEAALLEEARSGQSLIGSTKDSYLPFTKENLDRLLPAMERCEKHLTNWQRLAERVWILQMLLRAWRFNEAPLPATFELLVHTIGDDVIKGVLSNLGDQGAMFSLPAWLSSGEVKIGDVYEVKISNIDTYNAQLEVEPLKLLRRTTKRGI